MSTNLRKAQKHMQRATDLLNQSQLGFGVETREQKKRKRELETDEQLEKKIPEHDLQQIFQTNEQLEKKIRERVENREYRALQNMIDTGAHSSEYKEWMEGKMDKLKSDEERKKFMTKHLA